MSYYIILRGPLGCGKSTIALVLSKILNAAYVSLDEVLAENGLDKVDPDAECIPVLNFIQANNRVLPEVQAQLRNGRHIIFDACFYHKEAIEHIQQHLAFPGYIFTLKAPLDICIARDRNRSKSYGEDAARAVHQLVSRFDEGIIIDVTQALDDSVQNILSHLPSLH
ncbi:MAG: AAA family ATPase [Candidatus Peribacteraceae bacterium]|nr:AAA family ATPase [Candidatus Peribacteraceae bacterium]MDD5739837.1 AAA family ATPase [Candidatus Peribacteraceae bacterium]